MQFHAPVDQHRGAVGRGHCFFQGEPRPLLQVVFDDVVLRCRLRQGALNTTLLLHGPRVDALVVMTAAGCGPAAVRLRLHCGARRASEGTPGHSVWRRTNRLAYAER